jgi:hypothetical protein
MVAEMTNRCSPSNHDWKYMVHLSSLKNHLEMVNIDPPCCNDLEYGQMLEQSLLLRRSRNYTIQQCGFEYNLKIFIHMIIHLPSMSRWLQSL